MQYRHLGRTGLKVSPLCLGTMNFAWKIMDDQAFPIMDHALDVGINFFDTADMYGWGEYQRGDTERLIGRWLAANPARRDRIVLATKVYNPMDDKNPEPNRGTQGLSARKIMRHCEDSLRRLQTDSIDLYQMHHVDRTCPWDEIWQAMETLTRQGKIVYVGSSNFAGWDIASAHYTAAARNFLGLVSEQTHYNLRVRMPELEVIPACRGLGLGLIPWSPLAGGALAGKPTGDSNQRHAGAEKPDPQLEAYAAFCGELGHSCAQVALAWLLHNPVVTAPIIGPRTLAQLDTAVAALAIKLDEAALGRLNEIFPGPGGEAPKAYAW